MNIFCLLALFVFSVFLVKDNAYALDCHFPEDFTRHEQSPMRLGNHSFLRCGDPMVMKIEGNKYYMWCTINDAGDTNNKMNYLGFMTLESTDGIAWSIGYDLKPAENFERMSIPPIKSSEWEWVGIETNDTLIDEDGNFRTYFMAHRARKAKGNKRSSIMMATSKYPDGREPWVRPFDLPLLKEEFQWQQPFRSRAGDLKGGLEEPTVVRLKDDTYKMWYEVEGIDEDGKWGARIGYAWSKDGLNWEQYQDPVLEPGPEGSWDDSQLNMPNVAYIDGKGYLMVYSGLSKDELVKCRQEHAEENKSRQHHGYEDHREGHHKPKKVTGCYSKLGLARSENGINWKKDPNNPVFSPTTAERFMYGPSFLRNPDGGLYIDEKKKIRIYAASMSEHGPGAGFINLLEARCH